MNVIKRNGDMVEFDSAKIAKAIEKANNKVERQFQLHILPRDIARELSNEIGPRDKISVEEIQDVAIMHTAKNTNADICFRFIISIFVNLVSFPW